SPQQPGFQELGILATPGDSGGGWFIDINGEYKLAAITSDWDGFAGYLGRSYATYRTPEIEQWIHGEIQAHAVPEPASATLMLFGLGAAAVRRRRRTEV